MTFDAGAVNRTPLPSTPLRAKSAISSGAKVILEEVGLALDKATIKDLGRARKIQASKEDSTISRSR